jgi:hypothetical protein
MTQSGDVEYIFLTYVPNILSEKNVDIATILISLGDQGHMICDQGWQNKVRILDPNADVEMLGNLLEEIRCRLLSPGESSEMIQQLEGSFSNILQVSARKRGPRALFSQSLEDGACETMPPKFERKDRRDRESTMTSENDAIPLIK